MFLLWGVCVVALSKKISPLLQELADGVPARLLVPSPWLITKLQEKCS